MRFTFVLPLLLLSASAWASEQSTLSLAVDNDGVFGVDRDYTSGVFINYTSSAITPSLSTKPLSLSLWGVNSIDKIGFTLGQKLYTPSNISSSLAQVDQHPYAGYLYAEANYLSINPNFTQKFNVTVGTTGKRSLAEDSQKFIHGITGSVEPQGWQYQVDNQWAGSVGYIANSKIFRAPSVANSDVELSNISEVNAGNFRSNAATGFMLRWGENLEDSLGAANISSENPFHPGMLGASNSGWFLYTGVRASYVFNDLTVEGDRSELPEPTSLYEVTLEHGQNTAVAGFAAYTQFYGVNLSLSSNSKTYKESEHARSAIGGITLFAFF